jgi:hypothetical protein
MKFLIVRRTTAKKNTSYFQLISCASNYFEKHLFLISIVKYLTLNFTVYCVQFITQVVESRKYSYIPDGSRCLHISETAVSVFYTFRYQIALVSKVNEHVKSTLISDYAIGNTWY